MTENEARLILDVRISRFDHARDVNEALEIAKQALKEIQQYREIGTVEECKELAYIVNIAEKEELAKIIDEYLLYSKIGTVEECREAVERQKPKKPHRNYEKFSGLWCKCGWYLGQKQCLDIKYCPNCGQALQMESDSTDQ